VSGRNIALTGTEPPSHPFSKIHYTGTATKIVHSVFIVPQSTPKGLVISDVYTPPSRAKNRRLLRTPEPDLVSDVALLTTSRDILLAQGLPAVIYPVISESSLTTCLEHS